MPCDRFLGGFVCSRGRRPKAKPCFAAGCPLPAHWLCDFEIAPGKTCDRSICERHRRGVGPGKDHCLEHFYVEQRRKQA
jgi:hypothetical protein